jgi:hypothetical protein
MATQKGDGHLEETDAVCADAKFAIYDPGFDKRRHFIMIFTLSLPNDDSPTERIITLRITSERITSERINTERITS